MKDRNSFHSRAMAFSKISSTLKLLIFVSISGNHQLLGLEVSIYCRENMRGGEGAEGVQAPEMRLNQIGRLRHFIILNSGMYPQGRPVRPRSHLNFQIP